MSDRWEGAYHPPSHTHTKTVNMRVPVFDQWTHPRTPTKNCWIQNCFLVACTRLYNPLCWSVPLLVRWSVRHILFFSGFCGLWPHRSCPNDIVISNTAPAHPHATGVAVYLALFQMRCTFSVISIFFSYNSPSFHQGPRLGLSSKKSYGIS